MFETIITLIPLALFIAFRVIAGSQKNRAAARNTQELTALMAAKIKEKPPAFTFVPAPEPAPAPTARTGLGQSASEPEKSPPRITRLFPENLEHLPPLMRAAVCAEILGPPKGL